MPTRTQQLGLILLLAGLVVYVLWIEFVSGT
jgi:hypothetical protein